MFFAVILLASKKRLVLPQNWIHIVLENGYDVKRGTAKYTVFYSKDKLAQPDFNNVQEVREDFDDQHDGYYVANVLFAFGTYFIKPR